jgi:hypothetical protein
MGARSSSGSLWKAGLGIWRQPAIGHGALTMAYTKEVRKIPTLVNADHRSFGGLDMARAPR